ncbi:hypothetical protein TWF281_002974 [Arthrobotrys megalospora]
MFKGFLGAGDAKSRKKDRDPSKGKDRGPPKENPPDQRKIDILKFPLFPLKWPTPDMNEREWYSSLRVTQEDADYIVGKWWQKVQLFSQTYDPYVLKMEEELREANKTIRRLREERDAWRTDHDKVLGKYDKLKLQQKFKE